MKKLAGAWHVFSQAACSCSKPVVLEQPCTSSDKICSGRALSSLMIDLKPECFRLDLDTRVHCLQSHIQHARACIMGMCDVLTALQLPPHAIAASIML